ncbi:MAG: hypothetical protein ACI841_004189 [Planctomycetota bacterium]|jgi:hypothetical protein
MNPAQNIRLSRSSFVAGAMTIALSSAVTAQSIHNISPSSARTIQEAVDAAQSGDVIVLEPGRYLGHGNRDLNFGSKELILRSATGPGECRIECEGTPQRPFRGLMIEGGQTSATVIEGITFSGGDTLPGAIADQFNGGAIRMLGSSPIIRNCVFEDNSAGCWGGAVFSAHGGSPLIESCLFQNNVSGDGGGGFFSWNQSAPTIINSVFIGNEGTTRAGAIEHLSSTLLIVRGCTFVQNSGNFDSAMYAWGADVSNSIFWGNSGSDHFGGPQETFSFSHCNIEGSLPYPEWDHGRNISADPRFKSDGYHLSFQSPCINKGNSALILPSHVDIDLASRISHGRVDMGADEFRIFRSPFSSHP